MKYTTERGNFDSLQLLRYAYLKSDDGEKYWLDPGPFKRGTWDKSKLHASDVGGCPRATMYRLLGTPEKPRSERSKANREIMFNAGFNMHFLTYSALSWAGILLRHEEPMKLPEGWSGTLDAEIRMGEGSVFFDEKTVMPNLLNRYRFSLPKLPNCLQLAVYGDAGGNLNGLIEYTDRAGSNDPEECPMDLSEYVEEKNLRMQVLEATRDALPELPPILEQVYSPHYSRDGDYMNLKTVSVETPWNCGYCDYHLTRKERQVNPASGRMKEYSWTAPGSTCQPHNLPPLEVAVMSGVTIKSCRSGAEDAVQEIVSTVPLSYYSPLEETP